MERDSFVFYASFYEALEELPEESQIRLYKAIVGYGIRGIIPELSGFEKAIFLTIKPQIDANNARFTGGSKGGRPKKSTNETSGSDTESTTSETAEPQIHDTVDNGSEIEKPMVIESENRRLQNQKPNVNVNVNDNVNVNVNENVNDILYAQTSDEVITSDGEDGEMPFVELPLNNGTVFRITETQQKKWETLYPAVDVGYQLNKMIGWLDANPTHRKTRSGILKFCNSWLAKEQDRGMTSKSNTTPKQEETSNPFLRMLQEEQRNGGSSG